MVHLGLTYLGVVVVPAEAFYDVDLYRYWMYLALEHGVWPVLDTPWVYPAGALVPLALPALLTTVSSTGYALGWCALVTALDAAAVVALLRTGRTHRGRTRGAWWWLAFLAALGPVAVGRLDAVVAPLMVLALVLVARDARWTRVAATLLTAGAWIKVAPGALLLPLAAAARRPLREVVLPAAAVCVVVVGAVAAGGGLGRVAGFLQTQDDRGLQVESVAATGWVLASLARDDVRIALNEELITYEVAGPGTAAATAVLDVLLPSAVAVIALVLVLARRRGRAEEALLPAALVLLLVLVVTNKVGSPQFLTWVAAPLAVLLTVATHRRADGTASPVAAPTPRWVVAAAGLALVAAGLTQVVFPWGYMALLTGHPAVTAVLAARNVLLVALLATATAGLVVAIFSRAEVRPRGRRGRGGRGPEGRAPAGRRAAPPGRRATPDGPPPR